jgi:hypothetical protein
MLKMQKASLCFEPEQLMELEVIITDGDGEAALQFLRNNIYNPLQQTQVKCGESGVHPSILGKGGTKDV